MRVLDMLNKTFGNLTVIRRDSNSARGQARWVVRCDCSEPLEFTVLGNNLRRGNTVGCPHKRSLRGKEVMTEVRKKINAGIEAGLLGKQFGKLTVLSRYDTSRKGTRWLCSCSCGRDSQMRVRTTVLHSTGNGGCKYCKADGMKLMFGECMRNHLLAVYKAAAKRRNKEWNLSDAEFFSITQQSCHYCGSPPSERKSSKRYNGGYICNGVDRKNNAEGYEASNCLPCCSLCNRAKGSMLYGEFLAYLKRIRDFSVK